MNHIIGRNEGIKTSITKVKLLNGDMCTYDFCSCVSDREAYKELEDSGRIEYLGKGVLYSVNGVIQKFTASDPKDIWMFWRKTDKF